MTGIGTNFLWRQTFLWQFAWGLVLIVSFIGWGTLLTAALSRRKENGAWLTLGRVDWPLRAAWGMALAVVIGGVLCLFRLASPAVIYGFTAIGLFTAVFTTARRSFSNVRRTRKSLASIINYAPIVALVGLFYTLAVAQYFYQWCDDCIAYFAFASKILQTGTLIEPFSYRRLPTLGGHSFLQAMILCGGDYRNMYLLEFGIAPLILAGLVCGFMNRNGARNTVLQFFAVFALLIIPAPRLNTMSTESGLLAILALARTLHLSSIRPARIHPILPALAAALACTLRVNYAVCAVGFLILYYGFSLFPKPSMKMILQGVKTLSLCFLAVLPWVVLACISSGTFLYPLTKGYQNLAFPSFSAHLGLAKNLLLLGDFFILPEVVLLTLPMLLTIGTPWRNVARPLAIAAVVTTSAMVLQFTFSDMSNLFRYAFAMLAAASICSLLQTIFPERSAAPARTQQLRTVLAVLLLGIMISHFTEDGLGVVQDRLDKLRILVNTPDAGPLYHRISGPYQVMQVSIPPGKNVLAAVEHPALFDYRRNNVMNIDVIGAASLPPGMPFFEGPEKLKEYLLDLSIEYLAYMDFDRPKVRPDELYSRQTWKKWHTGEKNLFKIQAPFYLDFMENIDKLEKTEEIVFQQDYLKVMHLRR